MVEPAATAITAGDWRQTATDNDSDQKQGQLPVNDYSDQQRQRWVAVTSDSDQKQ